MGFLVVSCADVERACHVLDCGHGADLPLVDLHLLGAPGLELASQVSDNRPAKPVIVLTGPDTGDHALGSILIRGWKFLRKPFLLPDLLGLIQPAFEPGRIERSPERNITSCHTAEVVPFPPSNPSIHRVSPASSGHAQSPRRLRKAAGTGR
ncbi:MAG: response regulator [Terracidiphilus sp.]